MEKIKLGISTCLLGENVRYDGGHKHDRFLTDTLGKYVQYVPVCPEVECGLGVPRESMRLEGDPASPRLVTNKTGRDFTEQMIRWARKRVRELEKENLCGFIFKSDSPSSGMECVKVYGEKGMAEKKGVGIFARVFMEHFPLLPVEEEGRLHDPLLRENFIERIFALQRWQKNRKSGESRRELVEYHKLLLLAHSGKHARVKGKIIARRLLKWYDSEKRNLPWRKTRNPYRIWISEIMLQQTQVDTVIPYYRRFLQAFPTVKALSAAPLDEVLKTWENLGYYSRARHLHAAARVIVERFNGKFPRVREEILSLPGIGPYTAGAILSIAFGAPVAAVDGNVRRVLSRIFALKEPFDRPGTHKKIETFAEDLLPPNRAGDFNQALMDLGATICIPKGPRCDRCPVQDQCLAKAKDLQDSLPRRSARKPVPLKDMTAAVIMKGKRFLIVQRPRKGLLGGLWKFPGGLREKGETLESSLIRNVRDDAGIDIGIDEKLAVVNHAYSHFRVALHAFRCRLSGGRPRAAGCADWRWIGVSELPGFAFSKADRKLIHLVLADDSPAKKMV